MTPLPRSVILPLSGEPMKATLQRAISLFRHTPALWVPVIVATVISYGVTLLLHLLTHRMVLALITRHSVLGGAQFYDFSHSAIAKAVLIVAPIVWGGKFLVIGIFSAALVITARRVLAKTSSSLAETQPDARHNTFLSFLWFSAKVLAVYAVVNFLSLGLLRYASPAFFRTFAGYLLGFVTDLLLGLWIAPMVLRFLAHVLERSVPKRAAWYACGFAAVTIAIRMAFSLLAYRVEHLLFTAWPLMAQAAVQTVFLAGAVFAALPFVPFFVCLTLLLYVESPAQTLPEGTEAIPVEVIPTAAIPAES